MQQSTATRRLVKSPPELWAELSSEDVLGRHLAEFGEIRITRTSPQTTVAWEGDRASGTVELAPTGWGTKVILTATPVREPDVEPAAPPPPPDPDPVLLAAPPPVPELVALAPAPPAMESKRRGFFARLFRRRAGTEALPEPASSIPAPPAPTPDPAPPTPTPDPGPLPPEPDPVPPAPAPEPPSPPQIRARPELDPDRTAAILAEVLDDLGAAHHRPFSRG